ncbi:DUF4129 domain-containing protein [Gracilibacillus sp. S3-1-1]|uniref:DUF4129 domain-containing protein n=1 Tax=Gracilibacillus pellucidus TaxID=3095368 RepID=A0ACC6M650_9BACI|nr:DUF4129 domain-containing protein [Gracilibacillus sp. S3-1-1]MDX8046385.1 DUF4129 domain-containing protein [Gracilibacillus sp. S3-1-1]
MASYQKEQEQLNDILNGQEYQIYYQDNRSLLERLWDRFVEWIQKILNYIFESFNPASTTGNIITMLTAGIIIAIVLATIIAIVMITIRKKRLSKRQLFNQSEELSWSYRDHLQAAHDYETKANYRLATRHQFLSLLLVVDEHEWLEARQWKTNWDYYDELKQTNKAFAEDFYQLALFFEKITYGKHPITVDEYQSYQSEINRWIESIVEQTATKETGER